MKKNFPAG